MKGRWSQNLQFLLRKSQRSTCRQKIFVGLRNSLMMVLGQDHQQHPAVHSR